MVGLNLTNSWLNGRLNSNSSLFNNFSSSTIPSQFGHLVSPWICMPNTIDYAAFMGHREIYNVKESGFGVTAIDCSLYDSGHKDEPSLVWVHDKSFENIVGTDVKTDSMGQQNQNCSGGKQIVYNLHGMGHMHLSKMKFRNLVLNTFSPRKSNRIVNSRLPHTKMFVALNVKVSVNLRGMLP
uniref:Uncharacterized protein n=1 Tax=Fagus sylvatica TaxID=28930 RepID=A0A2N9EFJ6_FAGSY